MAEFFTESTLAVDVQGEEAVNRLTAALSALTGHATSAQRVVSAAGSAAAARSATSEVRNVLNQSTEQAGTLGQRLAQAFSNTINQGLRGPIDALRATATVAGRSLRSFAGPLGSIASAAGGGGAAILALGAVITGLAAPILGLVAGFRLLRSSFGWAQEAAEEQLRVAARTARFYPQLMGEGLAAAEDEMRTRMGVAAALFGSSADQMQESVTRRFTQFRLGRGLRGEADIFSRWGITPQGIERFEQMTGSRIDLAGWLRLFTIQREQLQQRLQNAQSPEERQALVRRLGMLSDDATKLFGQQFSDMMNAMNDQDLVRLRQNLSRATELGRPRDTELATRNAVNFRIAFEGLQETFRNLRTGIGHDVRPAITNFMTELNEKILKVDDSGQSLGQSLRTLASSLANTAWDTLLRLMNKIDVGVVNNWIQIITDQWSPEETADKIEGLFKAVWSFGSAIVELVTAIKQFFDAIPDWLKSPTPKIPGQQEVNEARRGAYSRLGERLGLGGGGDTGGGGPVAPTAEAQPGLVSRAGEAISGAASSIGNWFNRNFGISSARAGELTPEQRAMFGSAQPTGAPAAPVAPPAPSAPVAPTPPPAEPTPTPTSIYDAAAAYTPPAPVAPPTPPPPPVAPVTPEGEPSQTTTTADAAERKTFRDRLTDIWQSLPTIRSLADKFGAQPGAAEAAQPQAPAAAAGPAAAAPGPPQPAAEAPTTPAAAAPSGQETQDGFFERLRSVGDAIMDRQRQGADDRLLKAAERLGVPELPPVVAPHGPLSDSAPSQEAIDALKGAAAGRAMSIVTDVQSGSGTDLVMRRNTFGEGTTQAQIASYDPYADPSETRNRVRNVIGPWLNRNFGVTLPGSELATAAAAGTTEPAAWETQAAALTAPDIMGGWTGGMTTEDGAAFGTAAGQSLRQQLEGLSVGWQGKQSWENAANDIPWTGPNTPTDL